MRLGEKIRRARREAGFTQDDLADRLGVTKATISGWESLKAPKSPSIHRLPEICDLLGITLDELLRDVPASWPKERGHAVAEPRGEYRGYNEEERRVMAGFRGLKPRQREALLRLMEAL